MYSFVNGLTGEVRSIMRPRSLGYTLKVSHNDDEDVWWDRNQPSQTERNKVEKSWTNYS